MIVAGAGSLFLASFFGAEEQFYNVSAWQKTYIIMKNNTSSPPTKYIDSKERMLDSLRNKVIAFENEMSSSLSILPLIEKELTDVCNLRLSWISMI